MKPLQLFIGCLSIFTLLTVAPSTSSAEWFIDLYGGAADTKDADVTVRETIDSVSVSAPVNFATKFTVGGRFGYMFEALPWVGVAVDLSYFQADNRLVDISVFPVSFLLMLRWPLLPTKEIPKGRLQPYGGIGPGIFVSDMAVDLRPAVANKVSALSVDVGLDVRLGLLWQFLKHLGLFVEYRFTHFSPEIEEKTCFGLQCFSDNPLVLRTAETTLDTHHFLAGVSFRF